MRYGERFYRDFTDTLRWKSFRVKVETTDLYIKADSDFSDDVKLLVEELRMAIIEHIEIQDEFLTSFDPVKQLSPVHPIISMMYRASEIAGVGPMAAVAGAIAEHVGVMLSQKSREVIVENGGDIWMSLTEPVSMSVFAGTSALSGKLALNITPQKTPLGICTSSGRVGPSFSFGRADAATIIARDAALADAVATQTGNIVKSEDDLEDAIRYAMSIDEVKGALVIYRDKIIVQGDIEFVDI